MQRVPTDHGAAERLQKLLARRGLASRREAEQWIRAGRVTVNGELASLGVKVRASDELRLDGRLIRQQPARAASAGATGTVLICHRSPGQNLGLSGSKPETTGPLMRLPPQLGRRAIAVSPMPKVDGGLELLTSDGSLAVQLQRAVHGLGSEFSVRIRGQLNDAQLAQIKEGVLDRGARLEVTACEASGGEGANRWYQLAVKGGSGKDVRQLCERTGALVSRVLRTRLGPLALDRNLARGRTRKLDDAELEALLTATTADNRSSGR